MNIFPFDLVQVDKNFAKLIAFKIVWIGMVVKAQGAEFHWIKLCPLLDFLEVCLLLQSAEHRLLLQQSRR